MPAEASEALIELATGGTPAPRESAAETIADPFDHPDAQRRFRTIDDRDELAAALDYPWDQWTIFLHPAQKTLLERDFNGPARVSGSAGTGKTIVALHRAVFLARQNEDARVLLITFNDTLANALRRKLRRLLRISRRLPNASRSALSIRWRRRSSGNISASRRSRPLPRSDMRWERPRQTWI